MFNPDAVPEITPAALASRMREGPAPVLLDVREPDEWAIARLPGARLLPLATVPTSVETLDRDVEMVVYCHHGVRSAMAAAWLRERGFARVHNLAGGIDRWSLEVDAAVRRY